MKVLKKDYDLEPISLCSLDDAVESDIDVYFDCFKMARPLEPIFKKFNILSLQHQSVLFQNIWTQTKRNAVNQEITIPDVNKLWNPVFRECIELIKGICSRHITLKKVDYYFHDWETRLIQQEIYQLYRALEACGVKWEKEGGWIEKAVEHMKQYWSLLDQAEAAKTILELKDRLAITGNFAIIENVAKSDTKLMEDKRLDDIDEKLVEAKTFLEKIKKDKQKLKCLRTFADCLNVVQWIRKETRGNDSTSPFKGQIQSNFFF